jgi:hypothetical protein
MGEQRRRKMRAASLAEGPSTIEPRFMFDGDQVYLEVGNERIATRKRRGGVDDPGSRLHRDGRHARRLCQYRSQVQPFEPQEVSRGARLNVRGYVRLANRPAMRGEAAHAAPHSPTRPP